MKVMNDSYLCGQPFIGGPFIWLSHALSLLTLEQQKENASQQVIDAKKIFLDILYFIKNVILEFLTECP